MSVIWICFKSFDHLINNLFFGNMVTVKALQKHGKKTNGTSTENAARNMYAAENYSRIKKLIYGRKIEENMTTICQDGEVMSNNCSIFQFFVVRYCDFND